MSCWVQRRQLFEREGIEQKRVAGYRVGVSCKEQREHVLQAGWGF